MSATKIQKLIFAEAKLHSVRYNSPRGEGNPLVTSLYIMKEHLPVPFPNEVQLQILVED